MKKIKEEIQKNIDGNLYFINIIDRKLEKSKNYTNTNIISELEIEKEGYIKIVQGLMLALEIIEKYEKKDRF